VLWDGYVDSKKLANGKLPADLALCVRDAGPVLNADGPGKYRNPRVSTAEYDCRLAPLPAVELKL
jgi:hypothetical protein